jgi:hypothetical protein
MTSFTGRFRRLARVAPLAVILLLAARIESPTWAQRDSAVGGPLVELVSCVLPATADDPSSVSMSASETPGPDCGNARPDPLLAAWMTAC